MGYHRYENGTYQVEGAGGIRGPRSGAYTSVLSKSNVNANKMW